MNGRAPRQFAGVEDCVEQTLARIGRRIVLCTPIGAGKPVALLNEFYGRAAADSGIELSILTGLTLARPRAKSELERRLVEPISARIFGNAPEPAWIEAIRADRLPANIRVQEFFMEPGAWLGSPLAQQSYASINYTHVARTVAAKGANVIAQQIALRKDPAGDRVSLGSNPDVTTDLIPVLHERQRSGTPVAIIGQVNDRMPYMFGAAELPSSALDFIVDGAEYYHELIAPPNGLISTADHAIALAASMLVRDGGTIQIGIGELGDAIVHALTLRHRSNPDWRRALMDTALRPRFEAEQQAIGGDAPFERGLYAVSEMFVDGFLDLYREGILKRRVEPDGALLHGAFLLGPRAFYETLRAMPDAERALFRMMPVSFTNELLGPDWELKMAQRRDARFINSAMMATLGGALVSDGLADGRVVSGVGGQYNFVAQAHDLPGGRSLIAVRATRASGGTLESNIRFGYGHTTIPRHLRDIVLTEYGIADLRGKSDAEVAGAMLDIADSRFQPALLAETQRAGKLPRSHRIADRHRRNLPEALEQAFAPHRAAGRFVALPYGTDLTPEEIRLGQALRRLKSRAETLGGKLGIGSSLALARPRDKAIAPLLERMKLTSPRGLRERLLRRLVAAAL
ncbi:MAG TPA: acetyl-CoA hydrolase/transferase C-terminal domain-containing protein [Steroidobacteraceae bacterium]